MNSFLPTQQVHGRKRGFTLIELLVVVAIAGVLVAIAYPSYSNVVRKNRRADAVASMAAIQQAQERWRANNPSYAATLAGLPPGFSASSPSGYYGISIEAADASNYVVKATATAGKSQARDTGCTTLRLQLAGGTVAYGGCDSCALPTLPTTVSDTNRCWVR